MLRSIRNVKLLKCVSLIFLSPLFVFYSSLNYDCPRTKAFSILTSSPALSRLRSREALRMRKQSLAFLLPVGWKESKFIQHENFFVVFFQNQKRGKPWILADEHNIKPLLLLRQAYVLCIVIFYLKPVGFNKDRDTPILVSFR